MLSCRLLLQTYIADSRNTPAITRIKHELPDSHLYAHKYKLKPSLNSRKAKLCDESSSSFIPHDALLLSRRSGNRAGDFVDFRQTVRESPRIASGEGAFVEVGASVDPDDVAVSVDDLAAHGSIDDIGTEGQSDLVVGSDDPAQSFFGLGELILLQVRVSAESRIVEGDGYESRV